MRRKRRPAAILAEHHIGQTHGVGREDRNADRTTYDRFESRGGLDLRGNGIARGLRRDDERGKRNGAETVVRSMRAYIGGGLSQARVKELDKSINYIDEQNNAGRMEYVEAQKRHYPIGTGVTEAAAKTLVGTRMKRAGARFSQHGGQTVMLFRAALLSDRFDALHRQLQLTYTKPLRIAA